MTTDAVTHQLPNEPAAMIATEVGLLMYDPYNEDVDYTGEAPDFISNKPWMNRLRLFQQMTLADCELEECMIAYKGLKLHKTHKAALEIIYNHTKSWVKGFVMDELVSALGSMKGTNPEIATLLYKLVEGDLGLAFGKGGKGKLSGSIQIDIDDAEL